MNVAFVIPFYFLISIFTTLQSAHICLVLTCTARISRFTGWRPAPKATSEIWCQNCKKVPPGDCSGWRQVGGQPPPIIIICVYFFLLFHPQNWNAFEKYCRPVGSCTRIFQQSAAIVIRCFDQRSEASASDIRNDCITHTNHKRFRQSLSSITLLGSRTTWGKSEDGAAEISWKGSECLQDHAVRFASYNTIFIVPYLCSDVTTLQLTWRVVKYSILLIGFLSNIYIQARIVIHLARTQR